MKKILVIPALCVFLMSVSVHPVFAGSNPPADRTEDGLVPDFFENFEDYETDKWIEDVVPFKNKWSNNVLDDGEELLLDIHLRERAKIKADPLDPGNKAMYIDNVEGGNSFFYIGPKGDYRYKNFTASMRFQFVESGWVSILVRKDVNATYIACNNINAIAYISEDDSSIRITPYRNMPGSPDQLLKSDATLDFDGYEMDLKAYADEKGSYLNRWHTMKYEVNEKNYKIYIDGMLIFDMNYPAKKVSDFGYVSINACVSKVYIDDFRIVSNDTVAPPEPEADEPGPTLPDGGGSAQNDTSSEPRKKAGGGCKGGIYAALPVLAVLPVSVLFIVKKKENNRVSR